MSDAGAPQPGSAQNPGVAGGPGRGRLPLVLVVCVVVALLVGAAGLVIANSWSASSQPDAGARAAESAPAGARPTGSSIVLASPPAWSPPSRPGSTSAGPTPADPSFPASPPAGGSGTPMTVTYEVGGAGPASFLSYWQAAGRMASERDVALPWTRTVVLTLPSTIRLVAQVSAGSLRCRITVDGQVVADEAGSYHVTCLAALRPAVHEG